MQSRIACRKFVLPVLFSPMTQLVPGAICTSRCSNDRKFLITTRLICMVPTLPHKVPPLGNLPQASQSRPTPPQIPRRRWIIRNPSAIVSGIVRLWLAVLVEKANEQAARGSRGCRGSLRGNPYLAMGDISREADEQFAGERYDRDASSDGRATRHRNVRGRLRRWVLKFGPAIARRPRQRPPSAQRSLAFGRDGSAHRRQADVLWRAVDAEGEVLDMRPPQPEADGVAGIPQVRRAA